MTTSVHILVSDLANFQTSLWAELPLKNQICINFFIFHECKAKWNSLNALKDNVWISKNREVVNSRWTKTNLKLFNINLIIT